MKYWIMIMMVMMLGVVGFTNGSYAQAPVVHNLVNVTLYPLNPNTSGIANNAEPCSKNNPNHDDFGCTAIPGSTQYAYPYDSSTVTLDIEKEYLPHVVAQEMFPPEFHPEAVKAQARAARTYAYYQINTSTGEFDNSTNKQVFIPHKFEVAGVHSPSGNPQESDYNANVIHENPCGTPRSVLTSSQRKICDALRDKLFIASPHQINPINAEFFADFIHGEPIVGASGTFFDPISSTDAGCRAAIDGHGRGLSQKGASRWAYGNRCSAGSDQDPWSVRFEHNEQILAHYYPNTNLRSSFDPSLLVSQGLRWNMLSIDWNGANLNQLQFGTTYPVEVMVENAGIVAWSCTESINYALTYAWVNGADTIPGTQATNICNLAPGESRTVSMVVGNVPNLTGNYSLVFDMQATVGPSVRTFASYGRWWPVAFKTSVLGQACPVGAACAASTKLDLVFVVDTSGSMGDVLASLKHQLIAILSVLETSGVDYRIGVVEFRDYPTWSYHTEDFASRVALALTADEAAITASIQGLTLGNGGDQQETVYSGIMAALGLAWRSDAQKVVLVFSDAGPRDPELCEREIEPGNQSQMTIPCPAYTAQHVIAAANGVGGVSTTMIDQGVIIDSLTSNVDLSTETAYRLLSNATHGTAINTATVAEWDNMLVDSGTRQVRRFLVAHLQPSYVAAVGQAISFDASASRSAHGPLAYYEWDFNNDGLTDEITVDPINAHTYATAYQGAVRLTVSDGDGNSATTISRVGVPALLPTRFYIPFYIPEQP